MDLIIKQTNSGCAACRWSPLCGRFARTASSRAFSKHAFIKCQDHVGLRVACCFWPRCIAWKTLAKLSRICADIVPATFRFLAQLSGQYIPQLRTARSDRVAFRLRFTNTGSKPVMYFRQGFPPRQRILTAMLDFCGRVASRASLLLQRR